MILTEPIFLQGLTCGALFMGLVWISKELLASRHAKPEGIGKIPVFFTPQALSEWKEKMAQHIAEHRPYLQAGLRLEDLARELNLKPYQVSEILNLGIGATFSDYINGFRIAEVKRRLQDPEYAHMNILGIATDSGFNSKSVFNKVFRDQTGLTPSQYRAKLPPLPTPVLKPEPAEDFGN